MNILRHLLVSEDGSILIEVAFAVPVLVLLLFAGVDLTRYAQMIHKADQSAEMIAQALSDRGGGVQAGQLNSILPLAQETLSFGSFTPQISIGADAFLLDPNGTPTVLWQELAGSVSKPCAEPKAPPVYNLAEPDLPGPHLILIRTQICVFVGNGFYLSNILPLNEINLLAVSYRSLPGAGIL